MLKYLKILYELDNMTTKLDLICMLVWGFPISLFIILGNIFQIPFVDTILFTCGILLLMFLFPEIIIININNRNKKCNTYEDEIMSDTSTWD